MTRFYKGFLALLKDSVRVFNVCVFLDLALATFLSAAGLVLDFGVLRQCS